MAKYPEPGAVKTRLAAHFGDEPVCELYRAFLRDIARRFAGGDRQLVWAVHPPDADLGSIVGASAAVIAQEGGALAERMRHCFAALFAGGASRVVMIGADVPHLPIATIEEAFTALETADVALVPSADGGYCLVGLHAPVDVFSTVRMSTPTVLRDTLGRIESLGLSARLLAPSFDLDEPDDLRALDDLIRRGDVDLPFTRAVLQRMLA